MAHAAPSPIGHDIIVVSGQATMREASTFSTVTGSVAWRWLIGLSAPLLQFFAAMRGQVLGLRAALVHAARRPQAKNAAGRIASSMFSGAVPPVLDWIIVRHLVEAEHHDDVVVPAATARQASRKAAEPVAEAFSMRWIGHAGEAELLHHPHAGHRPCAKMWPT